MGEESGGLGRTAVKSIIGAVAAAITAALISWFAGWLPTLLAAIAAGAAWVWSAATFAIPIPAALLVLIAVPWLVGALRFMKRAKAPEPNPPSEPEAPLPDLALRVLQALAKADGRPVSFEHVSEQVRESRLLVHKACETLEHRNLITGQPDSVYGTMLSLTASGRDFVIQRGYVFRPWS
jgi:membrane protein implicated in regulation of membrane protease activity